MKQALLCAAFALGLGACSSRSSSSIEDDWLEELERLSFVPEEKGEITQGRGEPVRIDHPALLAQRYEVTNQDYSNFLKKTGYAPKGSGFLMHWNTGAGASEVPKGLEHHPVVFVSREDAQAYARWKGMRLPTRGEWERFACNLPHPLFRPLHPRVYYPWGGDWRPLHCNSSEFGLARTTAVGTFENGRSLHGGYDLAGNVWEWVLDPDDPQAGIEKGGSFDFGKEKARCDESLDCSPEQRSQDLGFRCVVDFQVFLKSHLSGFHPNVKQRESLKRAAARWSSLAEPSLLSLSKDPAIDSKLLEELRQQAQGR